MIISCSKEKVTAACLLEPTCLLLQFTLTSQEVLILRLYVMYFTHPDSASEFHVS